MNPVSRYASYVAMLAGERPTKSAFPRGSPWNMAQIARSACGCFAIVVLMTSATSVSAQSAKLPSPADPEAAVSPLKYESAFSGYQPFREQKNTSWKQVNKEVADHPGMGAMDSIKDMPDKAMPGMDSGAADESMGKDSHEVMAKAKSQTAPIQSAGTQTKDIAGTGIIQVIDKANGKVKLSHEPIAELGWPKMTMFFRLKDGALADQVKVGDKVEFSLEKSASGYVISGWHKGTASHDMKKMK